MLLIILMYYKKAQLERKAVDNLLDFSLMDKKVSWRKEVHTPDQSQERLDLKRLRTTKSTQSHHPVSLAKKLQRVPSRVVEVKEYSFHLPSLTKHRAALTRKANPKFKLNSYSFLLKL